MVDALPAIVKRIVLLPDADQGLEVRVGYIAEKLTAPAIRGRRGSDGSARHRETHGFGLAADRDILR